MKKVLSLVLFAVLMVILTGGILVLTRYQKNPEQLVPYPYTFSEPVKAFKPDAPILLVGDRMGSYMGKFMPELADAISVNLEKPIKVQILAKDGFGLHRTLHELNALTQWPQILIYQGASEEFNEVKFEPGEASKISTNFKRYADDRIETFMILYPWLSRIVYEPVKKVSLGPVPKIVQPDEDEYLTRLETELLLYEQQLIQLVDQSKDRNTLLILTTTPINLDIPPKKVCEFASTTEIDAEILGLRDHLKKNDPKGAYAKSSKLIKQYSGNAQLFFIHGQISKRLGHMDEAKQSLLKSSAFDCEPWRVTEVHNSIIRKVAKENQVLLFDFAQYLEKEWNSGPTFFDEIHPQNLFYERGMQQLGLVIKSILKL